MSGDERRAFGSRNRRVLQAILPLIDRPSVEIILGELREDLLEVDLPVAKRTIPRRALQPRLIAGIEALFAGRAELGVFHVKTLDAFMVEVDELDVIQSLLDEVARVIIDRAARMISDGGEELLERLAVENVLAWMQLKPDVDAGGVEGVEDRRPSPGEFAERGFDEMARSLRPWINVGPRERTAERLRELETEALGGLGGDLHLLDRPGLTRFRVSLHSRRRERVVECVIGRMDCDQLALKGGHELGDGEPMLFQNSRNLVGIGLACSATVEVEEPGVRARELQPDVA